MDMEVREGIDPMNIYEVVIPEMILVTSPVADDDEALEYALDYLKDLFSNKDALHLVKDLSNGKDIETHLVIVIDEDG